MSKGKAKVFYEHSAGSVGVSDAPMWDFLYRASTVRDEKYNIGDRVVLPDGRAFRYGKCGADLADMKHGVKNWNKLVTELDAIAVAAVVGAISVDLTFANTDGVANDGVIAKDELRGGYISFYRGTDRQQRGIIGNTARANGDTGNTTVYLDGSLVTAINDDDNVEVMANPYSDLRISNNTETSVMGMPASLATVGEYFWIQTWGPCRITPTGAELGDTASTRQFVFDDLGSMRALNASIDLGTRSEQLAGFILNRTDGAAGSAAPFINLQINP